MAWLRNMWNFQPVSRHLTQCSICGLQSSQVRVAAYILAMISWSSSQADSSYYIKILSQSFSRSLFLFLYYFFLSLFLCLERSGLGNSLSMLTCVLLYSNKELHFKCQRLFFLIIEDWFQRGLVLQLRRIGVLLGITMRR